jgi:hypothetical protein
MKEKKWLIVTACHTGFLADNRTPVGSGRFRDHAQDSSGILGMSFPLPLLSEKRAVWHTLTREHDEYENAS